MRGTAMAAFFTLLIAAACSGSGGSTMAPSKTVTPTTTATLEAATPDWLENCPDEDAAVVVDCLPELRTVTVEEWACEGGPCSAGELPRCDRPVKLVSSVNLAEFDELSGAGERFECAVQFHQVPVGGYTITLGGRAECGPACDAGHLCIVEASANHIAIRMLGFEDCPVLVRG